MPLPSSRRITAACSLALVTSALTLACTDSPTGPPKDRLLLALGDSVDASVAANDSVAYRVVLSAGQSFAVHLWGIDQPFTATVVDSLNWVYAISRTSTLGGLYAQWNPVTAPHGGTYRIVVRPSAGSTGGKFALRAAAVETSPEQVAATFQLGDTVTGESLDGADDIDDFTFDVPAGRTPEIFLQRLGAATGSPVADLYVEQAGVPRLMAEVGAAAPTEDLEERGSGGLATATAGRYHLRVQNPFVYSTGSYTGRYQFVVHLINPAPESAAAAVTPGDTILESIDDVGDIDTFTLTAPAGKQFNLFADVAGTEPRHLIVLAFAADSQQVGAHARVEATPGVKLLDQASGRFTMPATGTMAIVVQDLKSVGNAYRGPYRLLVYPIDSLVEGGSPEVVASATPMTSAIDQYGDVDAFHLDLTSTQTVTLRAFAAGASPGPITMALMNDSSRAAVDNLEQVPPGSYHAVFGTAGTGGQGTYRGAYQLVVAATMPSPEVVPGTLTVGETISTETIAWPRDVDTLHLAASGADTVVFELWRPAADSIWGWSLSVTNPGTDSVALGAGPWDADHVQTPRFDLRSGEALRVSVAGATESWAPGTGAAYRLVAKRVSAAPEHRGPDFALGDTVRDSLDYYGDIDDYVLTGPPGQAIDAQVAWGTGLIPPTYYVRLLDPTSDSVLATVRGAAGFSAPALIPPSGRVRVRVCVGSDCAPPVCPPFNCLEEPHPLGPYWILLRPVALSPESIAATFAFGDTVSGESIDDANDIDEFTFSGTAGQKIAIAFQWTPAALPQGFTSGLQLELVDSATNSVLTTLQADGSLPALDDVSSGTLTLPSTGTYVLRVRAAYNLADDQPATGPYRFRVTNVP